MLEKNLKAKMMDVKKKIQKIACALEEISPFELDYIWSEKNGNLLILNPKIQNAEILEWTFCFETNFLDCEVLNDIERLQETMLYLCERSKKRKKSFKKEFENFVKKGEITSYFEYLGNCEFCENGENEGLGWDGGNVTHATSICSECYGEFELSKVFEWRNS